MPLASSSSLCLASALVNRTPSLSPIFNFSLSLPLVPSLSADLFFTQYVSEWWIPAAGSARGAAIFCFHILILAPILLLLLISMTVSAHFNYSPLTQKASCVGKCVEVLPICISVCISKHHCMIIIIYTLILDVLALTQPSVCSPCCRLFCSNSLRKLSAGHNQLQKLPERVERPLLEVLDVQHNQLVELPCNLFLKSDR